MTNPLVRDADGLVHVPRTPGLGVDVNLDLVRELVVPLKIDTGVAHATASGEPGASTMLYDAADIIAKL